MLRYLFAWNCTLQFLLLPLGQNAGQLGPALSCPLQPHDLKTVTGVPSTHFFYRTALVSTFKRQSCSQVVDGCLIYIFRCNSPQPGYSVEDQKAPYEWLQDQNEDLEIGKKAFRSDPLVISCAYSWSCALQLLPLGQNGSQLGPALTCLYQTLDLKTVTGVPFVLQSPVCTAFHQAANVRTAVGRWVHRL